MKIGIILTPDARSKAYIQKITHYSIKLDNIILMNDNRPEPSYSPDVIRTSINSNFDISKSVKTTLMENKYDFKEFDSVNINNQDLIRYVGTTNVDYIIFSGGGILKEGILGAGPKFIHFHPGIVPQYRGSTCFYYSIIRDNNVGVTAFIMDKNLDTGDIVHQKIFPRPNHIYIDEVFDPHIRSETLVDVFKNRLLEIGEFKKQNPDEGETYHIIHPVLKHIAILSCI